MDEPSNPAPAPEPAETKTTAPIVRAPRARGMKRAKSGLLPADVPELDTASKRIAWLAERMAAGFYVTGDARIAAKKWQLAPTTVDDYASTASKIVEYSTGDIQKLRELSLVRLESIAAADGPDRLKAVQTALQVTGLLRGGAMDSGPCGTLTAEQADFRMISAIKSPDSRMLRILRAAFEQANPRLRSLLDEFNGVLTTVEPISEPAQLQVVNPDQ